MEGKRNGRGEVEKTESLTAIIPVGVEDGMALRVAFLAISMWRCVPGMIPVFSVMTPISGGRRCFPFRMPCWGLNLKH